MARATAGRQPKTSGKRSGDKDKRSGDKRSAARQSATRQAPRQNAGGRNTGKQNSGKRSNGSRGGGRGRGDDAIVLLKADHRQVEAWFAEFRKSSSDQRKATLAEQICSALKVHTTIEEEIFYPAFLEATGDEDLHHEAEIEHEGAKTLIGEIESNGSDDDHFDARVSVLSEMIKHHVNEEEQRGGMFAKARKSSMDLKEIGRRLKARKSELEGGERPRGEMQREQMHGGAGQRGAPDRAAERDGRRGQAEQQR